MKKTTKNSVQRMKPIIIKTPTFRIGTVVMIVDGDDLFHGKITKVTEDGKYYFIKTGFRSEYKSQWVKTREIHVIA